MNRIKELREKAGLNYRQLAEKIGITHTSLFYYEHGDKKCFAMIACTDHEKFSFIPLDSGNTGDISVFDNSSFENFIEEIEDDYPDAHKVKATLHIEEDD